MTKEEFDSKLDQLFSDECIGCDDHDPAPCPKCERMKDTIREMAWDYASWVSSVDAESGAR